MMMRRRSQEDGQRTVEQLRDTHCYDFQHKLLDRKGMFRERNVPFPSLVPLRNREISNELRQNIENQPNSAIQNPRPQLSSTRFPVRITINASHDIPPRVGVRGDSLSSSLLRRRGTRCW